MDTLPLSERQILDLAVKMLRSQLPTTWVVDEQPPDRSIDRLVTIRAPDGRSARVFIEAKTLLNTRDIPIVAKRFTDKRMEPGGAALVAARYLSPRAREALTAAGLSYLDATGNTRFKIDDPAVFIQSAGANSDPWRSADRPTNSLRGRPAARVVRALADMPPPWKVRDLSTMAGTSLGSTVRTLDYLDREALIVRDPSGTIARVSWKEMIERWAADYGLARERRIELLVEPRGFGRLESTLADGTVRYAISGSLAARRRAEYAEPRLALIYTQDADLLTEQLALRKVKTRPNVLVVEPEDDLVFVRTWSEEGKVYAALPQVAVDLLAGPGRNPEEGQALLRWMADFEPKWRKR